MSVQSIEKPSSRNRNRISEMVGARIRYYRSVQGMTQTALAGKIGISFQQLQKYEHGTNRISIDRLIAIADSLNCSVDNLLDDFAHASVPNTENDRILARDIINVKALLMGLPAEKRKYVMKMLKVFLDCNNQRDP